MRIGRTSALSPNHPIADAISAQREATGPIVVRLTGEGAWNAASAWIGSHGATEAVTFPFLPEVDEGTVWLHDAPGSRYVADILAAWCAIHGGRWVLLLTGTAVDGAHPSQGITLDIAEAVEASEATPTRVSIEVPDDLVEALARAADEGDAALAHALYEHLRATDPEAARPWCWVELLRLLRVGRQDEVGRRGPTLPDRMACRYQVLVLMAEAEISTRRERADALLQALESMPLPESVAADVAYLRVVVARDTEHIGTTSPHTTRHRAWARKVQRALGRPTEGPPPPGAFAQALERYYDNPPPTDAFLRVGDLGRATLVAQRARSDVDTTYLPQGEIEEALSLATTSLQQGDFEAAAPPMAFIETVIQRADVRQTFLWLLCSARMASQRGRVGELLSAQARLRAMSSTIHATRGTVAHLMPSPEESPDLWCATTLLRLYEACSKDAEDLFDPAFAALPTSPIVLGPYVLDQVIATGGMGSIWQGRHRLTGRDVAVKILERTTPETVRMFRAEIDVITRFDHPMIVTVLDLLDVDARVEQQSGGVLEQGQPALVMELVSEGTLADHIGTLAWPDIQAALVGVLEGLAYAHAYGVVHQDLKPQNILVGEGGALRLADFGLAGLDENKVAGTPMYMAPEQFRRGTVEPSADVYAVGCIGWALACGAPPFVGTARQLAVAHISAALPVFDPLVTGPPAFEGWLRRCLEKEPGRRFASAAAAAEALLAIESRPKVRTPRAPRSPYLTQGSPTFVLETLLDLPEHLFEQPDEATATRRLHDIFEERASWRPRIPTERLLHKVEAPVLFQREAQQELWTVLMNALGGRTQRITLKGRGGGPILNWLKRRARISGLLVEESPVPGSVCIVDMTDRDVADVPAAKGERWVLAWRDQHVAGARPIELPPFHTGAIWWMVYSRILLHPFTACLVAIDAVGSPEIAYALVDDWLEDPGVEMTERGLKLLSTPSKRAPRAFERWRRMVASTRPDQLRLAQLIAIKPFPADRVFLERVCDGVTDLRLQSLATACNGAWRMPPDLRRAVLETLDEDQTRELHRISALNERQPLARAIHECLADPTEANTRTMSLGVLNSRVPREVLEVEQRYVDAHLLEAPESRARWFVHQLSDGELVKAVWDTDPLIADRAVLEMSERMLPWPDGLLERVERDLFRPRNPTTSIRLGHFLSTRLVRRGRRQHAIDLLDQLAAQLDGAPDHRPDLLAWSRARCLTGAEAIEAHQKALDGAGVEVAPTLHVELSDELLWAQRFEEALHHADQSRGIWSLAADYNRAVALLALERDDEVAPLLGTITTQALGSNRPSSYVGLVYAELFMHLDEPTPMWEALLDLCVPIADDLMRGILERRLDRLPSTPRADQLRRALRSER